MAPQPEQGKPGWMKLGTACYYCIASITVQFMNKVSCGDDARRLCTTSAVSLLEGLAFWCSREGGHAAEPA